MANSEPLAINGDNPVIEARGLGHTYKGGHTALENVDLALGTGLFGLLGPNGAGKSTLMRIICTLLVPTKGTATVYGHDVTRERREVRELIGYLPQEFGAWRHHRAEEVLDTLARLSGLSNRKERRRRVAETLEMVGLDGVADRKVKKLSGGMVRRLGVAQALVHEPQVLIVDEPQVGNDVGAGCKEMALLDGGCIEFQGPPAELLQRAMGHVFEVTASAAEAERVEADYEIVSRAVSGSDITLRGVTANGMPDRGQPVEAPTLEEAYLAFMAARGRSEAARQDEEAPADGAASGEDTV